MIPRVERRGISPTTRATQAQVVRTGTRSAGIGERNIHHADCTNVTMRQHRVHPQAHLSKQSIPARWDRATRAGGTTAREPADTAWLSHTLQYTLIFCYLPGNTLMRKATSISHQKQNSFNERAC